VNPMHLLDGNIITWDDTYSSVYINDLHYSNINTDIGLSNDNQFIIGNK